MATLLILAGCGGGPASRGPAGAPAAGVPAREPRFGAMEAAEARQFLAGHPEALVLDVRNPDEWEDRYGHIEGARLIPLPELAARHAEIEAWKEKPVVIVCRSGRRSATAAGLLAGLGYRQVINLEGGMIGWRATETKR